MGEKMKTSSRTISLLSELFMVLFTFSVGMKIGSTMSNSSSLVTTLADILAYISLGFTILVLVKPSLRDKIYIFLMMIVNAPVRLNLASSFDLVEDDSITFDDVVKQILTIKELDEDKKLRLHRISDKSCKVESREIEFKINVSCQDNIQTIHFDFERSNFGYRDTLKEIRKMLVTLSRIGKLINNSSLEIYKVTLRFHKKNPYLSTSMKNQSETKVTIKQGTFLVTNETIEYTSNDIHKIEDEIKKKLLF